MAAEAPSSLDERDIDVHSEDISNGSTWDDIQPFRAEINRIVTHYIAPDSPRQLGLIT